MTPGSSASRPREEPLASSGLIQDLPVPGRFYQNVLSLAPGVEDDKEEGVVGARERALKASPSAPQEQATNALIEVVETAYDVSFLVPTATDVPADGREHRVVLPRTSLPVELSYLVAPRLRAAASSPPRPGCPRARRSAWPRGVSNGPPIRTWMVGETPGAELRLPSARTAG